MRSTRHDWTDTYLDELRQNADPEADACVREILRSGQLEAINAVMRTVVRNDAPVPAGLPAAVRAYFERTAALPDWVDPERVVAGQRLFRRYGLQTLQALLYRSLPECYAAADGAAVLAYSRRIAADTQKRVMETMKFVIDVMAPGGLGPEGAGVRSAQRVRLLHAATRAHILSDGVWDMSRGIPVNQEDEVATLSTFSSLVIDSLARLGAELSPAEQDAYMHSWNVIGALLGIHADALPVDHEDGLALMAKVRTRHHRRSEAGVALTRALLDFADEQIPGEWLDGMNASMVRFLCGDEVADILDVPPADWTRHLIRQYRRWVDLKDDVQDLGRVTAKVGEMFGGALFRLIAGRTPRPGFDIPASLRENWERASAGTS